MADIDLSRLNVDQLTELVGKAQTEVASREKRRRKDLRSELERRIAAGRLQAGRYLPGTRKWRRERHPASEEACEVPEPAEPRTGMVRHRADAEMGAGDTGRTGNRHRGVQANSDVPDSRVGREAGFDGRCSGASSPSACWRLRPSASISRNRTTPHRVVFGRYFVESAIMIYDGFRPQVTCASSPDRGYGGQGLQGAFEVGIRTA